MNLIYNNKTELAQTTLPKISLNDQHNFNSMIDS